MTGRRPTGAGAAGPTTGPNTVSPFRPRRPLGASLPVDDRAAALEARIRELGAVIDELADVVERYETGAAVPEPVLLDRVSELWRELETIRSRPFRRPRGELVRMPRR